MMRVVKLAALSAVGVVVLAHAVVVLFGYAMMKDMRQVSQ